MSNFFWEFGNPILRHSVAHFPPYFWDIACWVAEINAILCIAIRTEKLNIEFKSTISKNA